MQREEHVANQCHIGATIGQQGFVVVNESCLDPKSLQTSWYFNQIPFVNIHHFIQQAF